MPGRPTLHSTPFRRAAANGKPKRCQGTASPCQRGFEDEHGLAARRHQKETCDNASLAAGLPRVCDNRPESDVTKSYSLERALGLNRMEYAYICDTLRTPFGRYGGALAGMTVERV